MNVNMNAVLQFDSAFCRFIFLSKVQSLLSFDGLCALCFGKTRRIALSVGKSGSVFAERVCFLISSRKKKKLPCRISEQS